MQKCHKCVFIGKDRLMCFILKGQAGGQRLIVASLTFLQHVSAGSRQSLEASGLFVKLVSLVSSFAAPLCLSPINGPSLLSFWRCPRPPCPPFLLSLGCYWKPANAPAWKCQLALYCGHIVVEPFLNDVVNVGGSNADAVLGLVITGAKLAPVGVICLLSPRTGSQNQ